MENANANQRENPAKYKILVKHTNVRTTVEKTRKTKRTTNARETNVITKIANVTNVFVANAKNIK